MAKLRIDKVVPGNVVFHAHGGEDITILVDTKANILALTPTAGKMAYSSDTKELFIANGSAWIRQIYTPSGTINRTGGLVSSISLSGGKTITVNRSGTYISSITDGLNTWTYTRDANNLITSWTTV